MSERPDHVTHVYREKEWSVKALIEVLTENFAPEDTVTDLSGPFNGMRISVLRKVDKS